METQVAVDMISQLSVASTTVTSVWVNQFDFQLQYVRTVRMNFKGGAPDYDVYRYRARNTVLSHQLYELLSASVEARAAYERTQEELAAVRDQIRSTRDQMEQMPLPSPYATSSSDLLAQLYSDQNKMSELLGAADDFRLALQKQIAATTPLALLVVDRLKPGFDQPAMEQVLAEVLFQLFGQLDDLGVKIDPRINHVDQLAPPLPSGTTITAAAVEGWNCPPGGPEGLRCRGHGRCSSETRVCAAPCHAHA